MPIELSELMLLAMRKKSHLFVGELPRPIAKYLTVNPGLVYLGSSELAHILQKHEDISQEEIQYLHIVIKTGQYYEDKNRRNCVTIIWRKPDSSEFYIVGLKAPVSGEVWVQTMHRITQRKANKRVEKYRLLYP